MRLIEASDLPNLWTPFEVSGEPAEGFPRETDPCWKCKGYGVELGDTTTYSSTTPHYVLGNLHCDRCYGTGHEPKVA